MQPTGDGVSFLEAAQQGMFAIDTVAIGQIEAAITLIRDDVTAQMAQLDFLKTQIMLGDLDEAHAIAHIDTVVASADHHSLDFALRGFKDVLDDLCRAVEHCRQTYDQGDERSAQGLRQHGPG